DAPVPPFDSQKGFDLLGWESETGNPGWISSHDRIRRNILAHHTSGTDHHPVTQGDAREDQAFMSDPYIVANSDVPLGHRGIRSEVSEIVTKRRIRSQPIGGHVRSEERRGGKERRWQKGARASTMTQWT